MRESKNILRVFYDLGISMPAGYTIQDGVLPILFLFSDFCCKYLYLLQVCNPFDL